MKKVADLLRRFQRGHADVLGLDVAGSGLKAVRLRRTNHAISVVGVDILPSLEGSLVSDSVSPVQVPKALRARYVALATSAPGAIVKLLTFPAHSEKSTETHVSDLMGLGDSTDFRLAYEGVSETRTEVKILAVAMPIQTVLGLCRLFPAGIPAPCSIELAGLASMTAYARVPGQAHKEDCTAVVDFGMTSTLVAFFHKGTMVLVRKFDVGTSTILKRLQDSLGVDGEVALGILNDGSFDISQIVHQSMEAFLQQLIISWDFVERRENVHISRLYACGGGTSRRSWAHEMQGATGQEPVFWNPFEGLAATGPVLEKWKGQEQRFAAALGVALAMIGED
ncbi:MAG: pilus assembly protein PilM [Terrimicrobiaceae bacterium]